MKMYEKPFMELILLSDDNDNVITTSGVTGEIGGDNGGSFGEFEKF